MQTDAVILIAEDDKGHFLLVKKNLWRSCVENDILHFKDGQEVLDFLFGGGDRSERQAHGCYLLILDIRMPKVDGHEVLRRIKADHHLRKIPVIMLTTTGQVSEIDRCYKLGCSFYVVKPVDYRYFMDAVENLGKFLSLEAVRLPQIGKDNG